MQTFIKLLYNTSSYTDEEEGKNVKGLTLESKSTICIDIDGLSGGCWG